MSVLAYHSSYRSESPTKKRMYGWLEAKVNKLEVLVA